MSIKGFIAFPKYSFLSTIVKNRHKLNVQHLEEELWKLCYNHGINYYHAAIRILFTIKFLIG